MMALDPLIRSGFTRRQAAAMSGLAKLEVLGPIRINHDTLAAGEEMVIGQVKRGDVLLHAWNLVQTPWEYHSTETPNPPDGNGTVYWPSGFQGELYLVDGLMVSALSVIDINVNAGILGVSYEIEGISLAPVLVLADGPLKLLHAHFDNTPPLVLDAGANDVFVLIARGS